MRHDATLAVLVVVGLGTQLGSEGHASGAGPASSSCEEAIARGTAATGSSDPGCKNAASILFICQLLMLKRIDKRCCRFADYSYPWTLDTQMWVLHGDVTIQLGPCVRLNHSQPSNNFATTVLHYLPDCISSITLTAYTVVDIFSCRHCSQYLQM
jgi:hypothetical protein